MPHDVIMPALGMAQDSGVIVTWLKSPGDAVAEGDALFEVETDKATMEVEAQAAGYLTDVTAQAGAEVPVGQVIARVSDTPEGAGPAADSHDTPEEIVATAEPGSVTGEEVIMPALGMAQDTGLIVAWHKDAGDAVAATDILFEVETDKSTMEVEAGHDGYVAALLAEVGEEAPVGAPIAVISADKPQSPVRRSINEAALPTADRAEAATPAAKTPDRVDERPAAAQPEAGGRILASPKARRLALEQGLDLGRLAEAGYPQPYHVKDLETLKALPEAPAAPPAAAGARHMTAEIAADGFATFADWARTEAG
ncbi:biotin/lipoyl-containing protein, partial [Roseovarius salis]|uniref:biotin/lipoyl-containing protein n=1 Tax=Roseovarius salis TaxID=3376063 RepID=UPI0037C8C8FD